MKNKGFTLIEITMAVLILAAITLIAIPAIRTVLNNSNEKAYKINVNTIEEAAKSYHQIHTKGLKNELDSKGYVDITMDQLKEEGFIISDIENPFDNSIMSDNVRIEKISNNKYTYTYLDN